MREEFLRVLEQSPLFGGITPEELPKMLGCLAAHTRRYTKGEVVFPAGGPIRMVGIVLAGGVHVEQDDYWGNRAILAYVEPGGLFGEAFSFAGTDKLPVGVFAAGATEVLLIDCQKIITQCSSACVFHTRLMENMLRVLAKKNVALTQKMEILTQRTTRDELLVYLSQQAQKAGRGSFAIPFNRQELADFLAVDRSALSSELSKMQKEGLLRFEKNRFELL